MPDKPLQRKPVEQPAVVHEVVMPDEAPVRVLMESVPIQDDLPDRSGEVFPQQEPKQVAAIKDWFCRWKWDQTIDVGKKRLGVKFSIGAKACWGACIGFSLTVLNLSQNF